MERRPDPEQESPAADAVDPTLNCRTELDLLPLPARTTGSLAAEMGGMECSDDGPASWPGTPWRQVCPHAIRRGWCWDCHAVDEPKTPNEAPRGLEGRTNSLWKSQPMIGMKAACTEDQHDLFLACPSGESAEIQAMPSAPRRHRAATARLGSSGSERTDTLFDRKFTGTWMLTFFSRTFTKFRPFELYPRTDSEEDAPA